MERIPVQEARQNLADILSLVSNAKQRFLVQEYSKDRLGIVPMEDLALLESLDAKPNGDPTLMTIADIEQRMHDNLDPVAEGTVRIVVQDGGKELAALVPHRDLEVLESLDERIDLEAAKRLLDGDDGSRDDES